MADYDLDTLFEDYYTQYRAEATVPASSDDEYTIFKRYTKEAINHWATFDATYWRELYTTNQTDGSGSQTIVTSTKTYNAPVNFAEAGGFIRVNNSSGAIVQRYPIIEPSTVQFQNDDGVYAYFTKNPTYYSTGTASQSTTTVTGSGTTFTSAMIGMQIVFDTGESATITAYTSATSITVSVSQTVASGTYRILSNGHLLHLNPAPQSSLNGLDIDYVFYKKPRYLTAGASIPEMSDPYFIIHRALANRFRASRNPYYTSAKTDAENSLKKMQMDNNSGNWADPPTMSDVSNNQFGS